MVANLKKLACNLRNFRQNRDGGLFQHKDRPHASGFSLFGAIGVIAVETRGGGNAAIMVMADAGGADSGARSVVGDGAGGSGSGGRSGAGAWGCPGFA